MIVLQWIIPAVVGAVIGYVTNAIAIKMLFRPLTEKRIFSIRVPFTPGILPRQRHKLSESVANMVARDLLSDDVFIKRIASSEVQQGVSKAIAQFFVGSVGKQADGIRDKYFFDDIIDYVHDSDILRNMLEKIYPLIIEKVIAFLHREDIRSLLIQHGSVFLKNILGRLRTFQRFLLTVGNYNVQLQENMPQIVDSFIGRLEELLSRTEVRSVAIEEICNAITQENTVLIMTRFLSSFSDSDDFHEQGESLGNLIAPKLLNIAVRVVSPVLRRLDIKKIVVDKIDSLDMIKVEDIVFGIMRSQFKWINIFGGILGGLIGIIQSIISYFLK